VSYTLLLRCSPKESNLVSEQASWCPWNRKWVCLETALWELPWKSVLNEQLLCLVETTVNWAVKDLTCFAEMFPACLCTTQLLQFVPYPQRNRPVIPPEEIAHHVITFALCSGRWWGSCRLYATKNWQFYLHNLTCGNGPHLTSVMSSQCCDCCSPWTSKNWLQNLSWFT
jgi:hypothetical protein